MKKILKMCLKDKVVAVYMNPDETDCFAEGFIGAVNDEDILIHHISPSGLYDGYIVKKLVIFTESHMMDNMSTEYQNYIN